MIKVEPPEYDACVKQVTKSPPNNVYVYLSHSFRAKIPQYVTDRITLFLAHTFLPNREEINCTCDGLSLALRPRNVDRTFWTIGRGGAGKSLCAMLIDCALSPRR